MPDYTDLPLYSVLKTQGSQLLVALRLIWGRWWALRWIVANSIGWSAGMLAAALLVRGAGWIGALFAGTLLAAFAAGLQSAVLPSADLAWRRWIAFSALGGLLATVPVYLLGLLALLVLPPGLMLMGAVFGAASAVGQALLLRPLSGEQAWFWVIACAIAGSLCAPLTLSASSFGLPVFCAPGPLIFGAVTAWVLPRILHGSAISD